ncbi:MAG: hypothetical protein KJP22_00875 [Acidimicrobiia bacterium]|nr:hypothetical protein [Acidimicrobiia bacterium]MBT8191931.1 hypothetical protein [Acidimicrobiia bacterium]NNL13138.1 hypothetical protein [Acidimicrobiia bacterium]
MADIVFVAHELMSPLNASLALCRRLRNGGHEITYVSHADIGEIVTAAGFRFVRLQEDVQIRDEAKRESLRNPVRWLRAMRSARARSAKVDEIERVIGALKPDLLIHDIETHYAIIATASLGIPTILAMNWFTIFNRPGLPPPGSKTIPHGGQPTTATARSEWRAVRLRGLIARARHKAGKGGIGDLLRPIGYGTYHYADLNAVAKERGYSLHTEADRRQWLRPYTYTRYPIICFNAFEMELPHTPPANLHYVGPMIDLDREEPRLAGETQARWEAVKRRLESERPDRPLVYCSLGSYWTDIEFLRMIVNTFARRPEWDLILGLGRQARSGDFGIVPDNVTILEWAPQLEVLALADVAINHAGVTSVNECISLGVPIITYSPSLTDQDGVASRIAFHGVGLAAEWDAENPTGLEQNIERVLGDDSFRENARAMAEAFRRYETDRVAERTIEQLLAAGRTDTA